MGLRSITSGTILGTWGRGVQVKGGGAAVNLGVQVCVGRGAGNCQWGEGPEGGAGMGPPQLA